MFNEYYRKARLYPTVLSVIPLLILINDFGYVYVYDALEKIHSHLTIVTTATLSAALIFLLVQINRFIAKEIFQNYFFQDELYMPTTNHLLWKNIYLDKSIKSKIREKISFQFGIRLMIETEERSQEDKSRRQIITAVSQIRNALRENKMLLQHNIEYGFFRNLIGGSVVGTLSSVFLILFGYNASQPIIWTIGFIFLIVYLIFLISSKTIIKRYGLYYSKILYEQFLSLP